MKAIISVHSKDGIYELAKTITAADMEIISTGGTIKFLLDKGIRATPVEHYIGVNEVLDGRVKTLHWKLYAGLLARNDQLSSLEEQGIEPINLVVANLYPFEKMLGKATEREQLEYIDIGGVCLMRAAAKNFARVHVLTSPSQYEEFCSRLKAKTLDHSYRKGLAATALQLTANYDAIIANWLKNEEDEKPSFLDRFKNQFPGNLPMKYGENPHQRASFHVTSSSMPFEEISNKVLSYNNILDCDCAWRVCIKWKEPAVCIVKHATPCGIAKGNTLPEAYHSARACDKLSAFGGIAAFNGTVDKDVAQALKSHFLGAIVARDFTFDAVELLGSKANLRLVKILSELPDEEIRSSLGGYLIQQKNSGNPEFRVVTERQPDPFVKDQLLFAMKCSEEVKSNAIVLACNYSTVGIGGGLTSRVDAADLAIKKLHARDQIFTGVVMASDAFLPFPDTLELAANEGVEAIIQPGGSKKDQEIIDAANKKAMVMVFTGTRHFRH